MVSLLMWRSSRWCDGYDEVCRGQGLSLEELFDGPNAAFLLSSRKSHAWAGYMYWNSIDISKWSNDTWCAHVTMDALGIEPAAL